MKIWNQAPLLRLILPFISGILAAIHFQFNYNNGIIILSCILIILSLAFIPALKVSYKRSWIFGVTVNILLFSLGCRITISHSEINSAAHFSKFLDQNTIVCVRVMQSPLEKEKSLKMIMEITALKSGNSWISAEGKAMIFLKKSERSLKLNYGDEVLVSGLFRSISSPRNPGEFDYKSFLGFHNIYQQCSADDKHWISLNRNTGNPVIRYSYTLRDQLLNVLSSNNIKGDEFAVGAALMLGYSDKLDQDILSAYSGTGALHVLSVSGLHVAIVYVVFNWLLFFLDRVKKGNVLKAVILILLLWFYATLTGLSPSVLRAATMFSFIITAKAFTRYTNIYNTLAASAFILLIVNPFLLMDVGFQLSYIAVIGIVYLQPKIHRMIQTDNWLLEQIWTITAVSIAAQIATFPLGLYYFHQFPNYFLLSNLVVIPVSTVIIYLGIALFALAKITIISTYLALGFSWSIWFLNASVKVIEKMPHALIQGITISLWEMIIIYVVMLFFMMFLERKRSRFLFFSLSAVIILLWFQVQEQLDQNRNNKLIVYNVPRSTAIDFISSTTNVLLADSTFSKNDKAISFHLRQNWWNLGIQTPLVINGNFAKENLVIRNDKVIFSGKRIVLINRRGAKNLVWLNKPVKIDFMIISENPNISFTDLMKKYNPAKIIFDSSNSDQNLLKWKQECILLSQSYYSVKDSGAFETDI
jgi:competence protein ComEC